jgi:hypothetical protein
MRPKSQLPGWREWLPTLSADIKLRDPATESDVAAAEAVLHTTFDGQLRSLLLASDGIGGRYGFWLVWPANRIASENGRYRTIASLKELYMPFDHLLFIGEAGNGDLFAYPITADGNAGSRGDIFRWDHETDGRLWVAGGLRQYIQGFTDGTIPA